MGALHSGHAALLKKARTLAGPTGCVTASIFVNPSQFGPREDLSRYPRPFEADQALCSSLGVDLLFAPEPSEIYPENFSTWVDEESVSHGLCGAARPGHFRGVCTVVLKLFMICSPTDAVFGKKDFQQCAVISRMVSDLNLPVALHFEDTIRESDGLAMSSRNTYLSPEERKQAPCLKAALDLAREQVLKGETDPRKVESLICEEILKSSLARIDYVRIVDGSSLEGVGVITPGCTAAIAVYFGKTRLIDNLVLL